MKIHARLTKVDLEQRLVYGQATAEVRDKSGEIFDYASSKPHFEAWSADFEKATDGKSLGNVRAMHGDVAAGVLKGIDFDDEAKSIDVCAKIVDDAEWAKVTEGVYTGFSIGGAYERRWPDPSDATLKRFTARPVEISIVDNPCVPSARFSMIKADGVEERPFTSVIDESQAAADAAALEHATDNAPVEKGMSDVADLADLLSRVKSLVNMAEWEAEWEKDGSAVPAQLREWLNAGAAVLQTMATEEIAELVEVPAEDAVLAMAAGDDLAKDAAADIVGGAAIEKVGARHSAADLTRLQGIHDHAVGMGAACASCPTCGDAEKAAPSDGLQNGLQKAVAQYEAAVADHAVLTKAMTAAIAERDALQKRLDELLAAPAPAKGVQKVVAVEKAADATPVPGATPAEPPADATPAQLIKHVHQSGGRPLSFGER